MCYVSCGRGLFARVPYPMGTKIQRAQMPTSASPTRLPLHIFKGNKGNGDLTVLAESTRADEKERAHLLFISRGIQHLDILSGWRSQSTHGEPYE